VVNDPHPSGTFPADTTPDFSYGADGGIYEQSAFDIYGQQVPQQGYPSAYDGYSSGGYGDLAYSYGGNDPLFGAMPATDYDAGAAGGGYGTATYDTYDTYDAYAGNAAYGTGSYDTSAAWANAGFPHTTDVQAQPGTGQWDAGAWDAAQWETGHWETPPDGGSWGEGIPDAGGFIPEADPGGYVPETDQYAAGTYDSYAYAYDDPAQGYGTHAYQESYETAGTYETPGPEAAEGYDVYEQQHLSYDEQFAQESELEATAAFPVVEDPHAVVDDPHGHADHHEHIAPSEYVAHNDHTGHSEYSSHEDHDSRDDQDGRDSHNVPEPTATRRSRVSPVRISQGGSRRRPTRARRSALLSVAVPSVAVMGVAGAAAASVAGNPDTTTQASDDTSQPANRKLDTQLAGLSADADDFADRASRTQERMDLKQRQEAERERKEAAAARKEALRPKFALPVNQRGLSAQYGQAGLNWMSAHTGIDFPVSEGTPVMAATDGTVTTKYDVSFGNMAVVTAPDGTETWYCHLSSTKIRSGQVKAGDTIGYSGSSGNSTGPHLHFEVHPGGGSAIDPLPWLRSKGLEPT
jgi:murein DD-endopeptidase MepM/ murein hydrolase activator NlpD